MRRSTIYVHYCLFFLAIGFFSTVQAQQVFKITAKTKIGYLEYLPQGYHSNSNQYPVLIFLHGRGEKGPNSTDPKVLDDGVGKLTKLGPPHHVKNGAKFPFILITPQLKNSYSNWPSWYVIEVIEHVKQYLRVDESRIYLTGLSLGGAGTWVAAQDYPHVFAAIAPVCGGYNSIGKAPKLASANMGVWAFHGDKDTTVPLSRSVNMVNAINSCNPAPNPKAKMTIYPGVRHNAWLNAYQPDNRLHKPNMYEWMLSVRKSGGKGNDSNTAPVANAGKDRIITLPTNHIVLNGSGSDADGKITAYQWSKIAGGNASLSATHKKDLTVSELKAGTYTFRLTVKDDKGAQETDDVSVDVRSAETKAPTVTAGEDKTITLPTNAVKLEGKATASGGKIAAYEWKKVSGGTAKLKGDKTNTLHASDLQEGNYVFRLTVEDNNGATAAADVSVTVKRSSRNDPPVPSAGPDHTLTWPANEVVLKGSGADADGKIASYSWSKRSGGSAKLSGQHTSTLTVSGLKTGNYVFRLLIKDDQGASRWDEVNVFVKKESMANKAPVAHAGPNISVKLPVNAIVLQGSGEDQDGTIAAYSWKKLSGGAVNMGSTTQPGLSLKGLKQGRYTFRLTVKDNSGATHHDAVLVVVKAADKSGNDEDDQDQVPPVNTDPNKRPVADAGTDKSIALPSNSVVLKGRGADHDGTIAAYAWRKLTGPGGVKISGSNSSLLTVEKLKPGNYLFRLSVKDNRGATHFDDAWVFVKPASHAKRSAGRMEAILSDFDNAQENTSEERSILDESFPFDLATAKPSDIANFTVTVYNERGERLFTGRWQEDSYQQVFNERGLYLYKVGDGQQRFRSGKIYIVE